MAQAIATTIKIDPQIKEESQELFESLGLSLTAAINMFLRQAIREQAIPFRVGEPVYNDETLKAILEARQGIGLSRPFSSVNELWEDLNADD